MKILMITTMGLFPRDTSPMAGIFFLNLLKRLNRLVDKIVCVVPSTYVPGPLTRLPRLATHGGIRRHEWRGGMEVYRPPYLSFGTEKRLWLQGRSFMHGILPLCESLHRRHRFDTVVAYGFDVPAYAGQITAKHLGLRDVTWAIGSDVHTLPFESAENAALLRHNIRYNDLILTDSDDLRRRICLACPSARNAHTFYRGNQVDAVARDGDRDTLRRKLGLADGRKYMLMSGRLVVPKGSHEFIEAFVELAGRRSNLDAVWVGDGPQAGALRRRAEGARLGERLHITGKVHRRTVLEYMRAADFMLFTSHAEGLPTVVMESLMCGLPTVATDVGGVREVVADGVTGVLARPKDPASLVAGAERLLADEQGARAMSQKGRQLILEHFDVEKNAPVALEILRHVASGGPTDIPLPACAGVAPGRLPIEMI